MIQELHLPWLECFDSPSAAGLHRLWSDGGIRSELSGLPSFAAALTLLCTIGEWADFVSTGAFEAHDHWDVIQMIFRSDIFVIDQLSAPLLPLSLLLLYLMTILSTLRTKLGRFSFGLTLISEAIVLATLSCHSPWVIILLLSPGRDSTVD